MLRSLIGRRFFGTAAIIGGIVWLIFWTFHTIAHGPQNPAPTSGTFLGYTSLEHARLMMLIASPLLIIALIGLVQHEGKRLGRIGRVGIFCTLSALAIMFSVSVGLGPWMLYALSVLGLCSGLVLLGIGTLKLKEWSFWSRCAPLITSIVIPLIVVMRLPGSPVLKSGDVSGYVLLEAIGAALAYCWIAIGFGLSRSRLGS